MNTAIDRLLTLCIGFVIGVAVMYALAERSDENENTSDSVGSEREAYAVQEPISPMGQKDGNADPILLTQVEVEQARSADQGEPNSDVTPISIPDVYEDHITGRNRQPSVSIADVHKIFKNEARDESWAVAMESGINHYLANSGSGGWAVVEYVECRSRICELAGYTTDSDQNGTHDLIGGFLTSGLWQGNPITHSTRFGPADRKRFVIIISGYEYSEYASILSSL